MLCDQANKQFKMYIITFLANWILCTVDYFFIESCENNEINNICILKFWFKWCLSCVSCFDIQGITQLIKFCYKIQYHNVFYKYIICWMFRNQGIYQNFIILYMGRHSHVHPMRAMITTMLTVIHGLPSAFMFVLCICRWNCGYVLS